MVIDNDGGGSDDDDNDDNDDNDDDDDNDDAMFHISRDAIHLPVSVQPVTPPPVSYT